MPLPFKIVQPLVEETVHPQAVADQGLHAWAKAEHVLPVATDVAVRGFGLPGYFRISFCVDDKTLEGSLEGFRAAIKRF